MHSTNVVANLPCLLAPKRLWNATGFYLKLVRKDFIFCVETCDGFKFLTARISVRVRQSE